MVSWPEGGVAAPPRDEVVARDLLARLTGALDGVLLETLLALLLHGGERRATAESLGVAPATLRKRLQRIRETLDALVPSP